MLENGASWIFFCVCVCVSLRLFEKSLFFQAEIATASSPAFAVEFAFPLCGVRAWIIRHIHFFLLLLLNRLIEATFQTTWEKNRRDMGAGYADGGSKQRFVARLEDLDVYNVVSADHCDQLFSVYQLLKRFFMYWLQPLLASLYNSLVCVLCFNRWNINDSKQNSRWINSGWYDRTGNPSNDLNIWTPLTQWPG